MKKSTKIIVAIVSVVLIASLAVILVILLPKLQKDEKKNDLEENLKTMVVDYYENEFKKLMPDFLATNGYLKVTLDYLQGIEKDVKVFEEHKCDYNETYVDLIMDEGSETYRTEVNLKCEY